MPSEGAEPEAQRAGPVDGHPLWGEDGAGP